jgi:hypothetical protein
MKTSAKILAAVAFASASPSLAATVDFTGHPTGFQTNPFSVGSVTFGTPGSGMFVFDYGSGTGNTICATQTGSFCDARLDVSFASAVTGFSFLYAGLDVPSSSIGVVLNFTGGGSTALSFTPLANNSVIDLTSYTNVVSASITTTDTAGLIYDNFTFLETGAVPEPATWAMLILGFGVLGNAMRRRSRGMTRSKAALRFT